MPKIMVKFERHHHLRGRQMQVEWVTRSAAIAEGLRDALVTTNLATTKHPILK